jgi:hypothetical protein
MDMFSKPNNRDEDQSKLQGFLKFDDEAHAKVMNNLQSSHSQIENAIGTLQGDWEAVKAKNKYLWKQLKKSKAKDEARKKIIADQNNRLLSQEEKINELKSSHCELEKKFLSLEEDYTTIKLSKVTLRENMKKEDDQKLAIIETLMSQNVSQMADLSEKDGIINMATEELAIIKSALVQLEEVVQLPIEKSFEDEATASVLNQRHFKKALKSLAELFGDRIPTSKFHLKSNRKKRWTSAKMNPLKFLNALEKNLKKGKLDGVIDEKLGKSPEGVSMSWRDAIQQFVDAARREFIDTSAFDNCSNHEAEFERLIKARYILESAETNQLKPIPVDVHKCMFQIVKQQQSTASE